MKPYKKHYYRQSEKVVNLNEAARSLEEALRYLNIPISQRSHFLRWSLTKLFEEFKIERMNYNLYIENTIRQAGITLPNGTVNKPYHFSFRLPSFELPKPNHPDLKISNFTIEGLTDLGLDLYVDDEGYYHIVGTPLEKGDYTLVMKFNTIEDLPPSEISMPIAFNPDPRSLWVMKDSDPNMTYYKPDSDCQYIKVDKTALQPKGKDIVAASQRGRSHGQEGKARDDDFEICHCSESDWYILAVADGAGSATYSRKGSAVACETVVDYCKKKLEHNADFENAIMEFEADRENVEKRAHLTRYIHDIVFLAAAEAQKRVLELPKHIEGSTAKDFATTLMFAIAKKFSFGWFISSFWVGDGAIAIFNEKDKTLRLLGQPDEGEFSGQTRFLTMREVIREKDAFIKRIKMSIVDDFTALFLMTDGVSDAMFASDKALNDFESWKNFYDKLNNGFPEDKICGVELKDNDETTKDRLLSWLDFWSPGNHDDRTIAILY